jgi:hypothetical protein
MVSTVDIELEEQRNRGQTATFNKGVNDREG